MVVDGDVKPHSGHEARIRTLERELCDVKLDLDRVEKNVASTNAAVGKLGVIVSQHQTNLDGRLENLQLRITQHFRDALEQQNEVFMNVLKEKDMKLEESEERMLQNKRDESRAWRLAFFTASIGLLGVVLSAILEVWF